MENENLTKKGSPAKKVVLILLAVILFVVAAVAVLYFTVFTNPVNVYKKLVAHAIDSVFVENTSEKQSFDMDLDVTIDLEDEDENPLVDLINKIDLAMNVQLDNKTKETVLHINSTYGREKLASLSMFLDYSKGKGYIYAKEYFDKYLEVDIDEESGAIDMAATQNLKMKSEDDAKKILTKEITNIITDEMCSKKDDSYILKTTNIKLVEDISDVLENLKSNDEFLACFESQRDIKQFIEEALEIIDYISLEEQQIEIAIYTDFLLNVEKATIKLEDMANIYIKTNEDKITVEVEIDNQTVMTIETKEDDDSMIFSTVLSLKDIGKITIKSKFKDDEIEKLDKINTSKVMDIEELTDSDMQEIMDKIQNSKLGKIISDFDEAYEDPIEKAEQAIIASNVASINSKLTLAYANMKIENTTLRVFDDTTVFTVSGKKYIGLKEYYKEIVPEIDEKSSLYAVPEGYVVEYYENGTAMLVEM